MLTAIDMRPEPDVVLVHLAEGAHAEGLEAAAVGEDGARPSHEPVQAAKAIHRLHPRSQVQMVGVAQDYLRPQVHYFVGSQRLDGGLGCHGHENGGVNGAVGRVEPAGPGAAIPVVKLECKAGCGH